ncbi:MAG TPA: hypothetical protein VKQ36_17135 [Ktedonobacterales bacterium]|nr:hypothetical protein [Ktedonobacterales bacterium]
MSDHSKPVNPSQSLVSQAPSVSAFEAIKHVDENSEEYWLARELAKLLGYERWENFAEVIEEAKEVCRLNGGNVDEVFVTARKTPREKEDAQAPTIVRHATPATSSPKALTAASHRLPWPKSILRSRQNATNCSHKAKRSACASSIASGCSKKTPYWFSRRGRLA